VRREKTLAVGFGIVLPWMDAGKRLAWIVRGLARRTAVSAHPLVPAPALFLFLYWMFKVDSYESVRST
jgi:hypothetical protein